MILNRNLIYDLTLGDGQRIPEANDNAIVVPPIVVLVSLNTRPHRLTPSFGGANTGEDSLLTDFFTSRVNQAGTNFGICQMPAGLWELELTMATSFDYTPAPPLTTNSPVDLQLFNPIQTVTVLSRFPQIGSFTDFQRLRCLFREPTTLSCRVPATGVSDDLAVKATANAIRIL